MTKRYRLATISGGVDDPRLGDDPTVVSAPHWIVGVGRSFPTLAELPDDVLDYDGLDREMLMRHTFGRGSGARYAGEFILSLWDGAPFDIRLAWAAWDAAHRAAWLEWARDPRWA